MLLLIPTILVKLIFFLLNAPSASGQVNEEIVAILNLNDRGDNGAISLHIKINIGGSVAEWFRALDLKCGGPWFKSASLPLPGLVLGSP